MEREKPGLSKIRLAMLTLLKSKSMHEITVSELCKCANVSRSTFYAHFSNVYDVYRNLILRLLTETSTIRPQLKCSDCKSDNKTPLCLIIRESKEYSGLVSDDDFMPAFLDVCRTEFHDESLMIYYDACNDEQVARALHCFQIMGCIAAAKMIEKDVDWSKVKQGIDTFIRCGLNGIRSSI